MWRDVKWRRLCTHIPFHTHTHTHTHIHTHTYTHTHSLSFYLSPCLILPLHKIVHTLWSLWLKVSDHWYLQILVIHSRTETYSHVFFLLKMFAKHLCFCEQRLWFFSECKEKSFFMSWLTGRKKETGVKLFSWQQLLVLNCFMFTIL